MEAYFSNLFEDVTHERSSLLLLTLRDPDILKQSKFTDDEIKKIKNLAWEDLHRQRMLKGYFAFQLIESYFLFNKWVHIKSLIMKQNYQN